jgi:serine/threonine protein kinase
MEEAHVDETILQTLGKYRIESILGRGAMGVVYKGYDTVIQRFVALKVIRADLLVGEDSLNWLARFKREVQAAGRCLHPNIVTVFEYGEEQGIPYIIMEYVQGRELQRCLRDQQCFDTKTALHVIIQVLSALDYAHECGVVHRDIKPGNIILLEKNLVKVADFGIACIDSSSMTQYGLAVGTPGYMAPEQFRGGQITRAADIYATGAVLFELLTGQKLFSGRTTTEVLHQVLKNNTTELKLDRKMPSALQTVIHKALARNPQERFQTAREFAAALEQAVPEYFVRDNPVAVEKPPPFTPSEDASPLSPTDPYSAWEPRILREAEEQLVLHVGPMAKVMVKQAAWKAVDIQDLYQRLAEHITTEPEKSRFLQRGRRLQGGSDRSRVAVKTASTEEPIFSSHSLATVTQQLTVYLGPIAKVLVNKTAGQSASLEDLYQRLSSHIPSEAERIDFLKKIPT